MSTDNPSQPGAPNHCPACGAAMASQAILCVVCGYHLTLGHHLATNVERSKPSPLDRNPYASPNVPDVDAPQKVRGTTFNDLTEAGARQAEAVVADAQSVFLVIGMAWCICAPAWFIILPWYLYRIYCWHSLASRFSELRFPNGFSPYGELAGKFHDARGRLMFGAIAGSVFWILIMLGFVASFFQKAELR